MKYLLLLAGLLILSGCAATPEFANECKDLFSEEKEIEKCEKRVERSVRQRAEKEALEAAKESCISRNMVWWGPDRWGDFECISSGAARDRMNAILNYPR